MTNKARTELLEVLRPGYRRASRKDKTRILENFTDATSYSRKHAVTLLNHGRTKQTGDKAKRQSRLGEEAIEALVLLWSVSNRLCSKRLVPFLPELLDDLEGSGQLRLSDQARSQLLSVSAATVDRVLRKEKAKYGRSPSTTKRATLVKNKVPVRTFTEWNDVSPGFFEVDTVGHSSSDVSGPFLSTLNMTDIATCWTEPIALFRKGSIEVIAALDKARDLIPFPILGLDCDNGSEFLNELLIHWCEQHQVTFTRSREYKKNDQAWIEEKNGSVVRKNVGRERYEGQQSWSKLSELYSILRLYFNFYQPCQKLLFKHRNGAKTFKKHDSAKTPYQRVLENPHVPEGAKAALRKQKEGLDICTLFNRLGQLQAELKAMAVDVPNPVLAAALAQRRAVQAFLSNTPPTPKVELAKDEEETATIQSRLDDMLASLTTGTIITAKHLNELGSRAALDRYLSKYAKSNVLKRVGWGVYALTQAGCEYIASKNSKRRSAVLPKPAKVKATVSTAKSRFHDFVIGSKPGTLLTVRELGDLGSPNALAQYLHAYTKNGILNRTGRGIYQITEGESYLTLLKPKSDSTNSIEATV